MVQKHILNNFSCCWSRTRPMKK